MKQYTVTEIESILLKTSGSKFAFDESDKKRALTNQSTSKIRKVLSCDGDRFRGTPIPELPFSSFKRFDIDGDRKDFEGYYLERRRRLLTFSLLVWLYRREEDVVELENIVWAILGEYTWVLPAHLSRPRTKDGVIMTERVAMSELQDDGHIIDLFSAETASALAEMLSLVGDMLSPIIVKRVEAYVKNRIFDVINEPFNWKASTNNWSAVCGGACGIAAIYLEKDAEKLAKILKVSLDAMSKFVSGYTEDGCCIEGMSYWIYGFGYFTYFADLLYRRTSGIINLFDDPKIAKMAEFPQKCFLAGNGIVYFSDTGTTLALSPSLPSFLAKKYDSVAIPPIGCLMTDDYSDNCSRFALGIRDFIWTDENLSKNAMKTFGTYILPNAEWYIASAESGIGIAAKAGRNDEPHNHNDVGSFHIYKNGRMTLADVGSGEYVKDYFGPHRYEFFPTSSAAHNLPIVNGKLQVAGSERVATDTRITQDGICTDIARTYDDETLKSLKRSISFDAKSGNVTIEDDYDFSVTPTSVIERFVSFDKPIVSQGEILIGGAEGSTLYYDPSVLEASIACVPYSGPSGVPTEAYTLDLSVKTLSAKFSVKFNIS